MCAKWIITKAMKMFEAPIGQRVALVEKMDLETRWIHYERRDGIASFNSNPDKPTTYVPVYRLRTVQGIPGEVPRYDSGEIRIETEIDGRISVAFPTMPAKKTFEKNHRLALLLTTLTSDDPLIMDMLEKLVMTAMLTGITPKHDFYIGCEFTMNERRWRCTDVGTRIITAIRIDSIDVGSLYGGPRPQQSTLNYEEANKQGWFNGPPYACAEVVFDENDLDACEIDSK